ncbi:MAG: hypothetical protein WC477_05875 [Patescibacteria group bacterium]
MEKQLQECLIDLQFAFVNRAWHSGAVHVEPTRLELHQHYPEAPPFPIRIDVDALHLPKSKRPVYDIFLPVDSTDETCRLIMNPFSVRDGLASEMHQSGENKQITILADVFFPHPIVLDACMKEMQLDPFHTIVCAIIDCGYGNAIDRMKHASQARIPQSLMTCADFMCKSRMRGFLSQQSFVDVQGQFERLMQYLFIRRTEHQASFQRPAISALTP